jgi:hypothetical protein
MSFTATLYLDIFAINILFYQVKMIVIYKFKQPIWPFLTENEI